MPVNGDELHAGFGQPLRHQHALPERVVAVPHPLGFRDRVDVERLPHFRGKDHVHRLLVIAAQRLHMV